MSGNSCQTFPVMSLTNTLHLPVHDKHCDSRVESIKRCLLSSSSHRQTSCTVIIRARVAIHDTDD